MLAEFNGRIHGDDPIDAQRVAAWTRDLLARPHPTLRPDDFTIVEEIASGKIISSMNLIPQTWLYEGIEFGVGRPELVGTAPEFRNRGLVRIQFEEVHKWSTERGHLVQAITGIPYYYRQFGFGYSVDGNVLEVLPVWRIPDASSYSELDCPLRPATLEDIPRLAGLYEQAMRPLDFWLRRSPALWAYLLQAAKHPFHIIESPRTDEALGYASLVRTEQNALIYESSLVGAEAALALLQTLGRTVKQKIQIAWPESNTLAQLAHGLG